MDSRADRQASNSEAKSPRFSWLGALCQYTAAHGSWDFQKGQDLLLLVNSLLWAKKHVVKASFFFSHAE